MKKTYGIEIPIHIRIGANGYFSKNLNGILGCLELVGEIENRDPVKLTPEGRKILEHVIKNLENLNEDEKRIFSMFCKYYNSY